MEEVERLTVEKKGKTAATANEISMPHVLTKPHAIQPGFLSLLSGLQMGFKIGNLDNAGKGALSFKEMSVIAGQWYE